MPSEIQQEEANLQQPWKEWYEDLKEAILKEDNQGSLIESNAGDSGNHGTTSLQRRKVDLALPKKKMVTEETQAKAAT